jgi:hypothetical protein
VNDREDQLRVRAYHIWQAEGCPQGRDRNHWEMAERELDEATADSGPTNTADPTPKRKSVSPRRGTIAIPTESAAKARPRKPRAAKSN